MTKTLPRGIRNNNPGNLEWGDPWQGLVPIEQRTDPRFCQFETPAYGIRALAKTLITYFDRHGIRTVEDAISRWAPHVENDTLAYQNAVARAVGVPPNQVIDFHDYGILRPMVEAIIRHENGVGPLRTANTWYTAAAIDEGLHMAGVRPNPGKVLVTKETVGATATGAVGVVEIADALPSLMTAIRGAEGHLSSGSVSRILIGVALVALAAFIAYGQVKKHQQGAL